jgi:hypothetical protein
MPWLNLRLVTFIYIPCDIISLVLQGTGSALSAGATIDKGIKTRVDVSKAGLVFQVVTLILLIVLSTGYLLSIKRSHKKSSLKIEN